MNLRFESPEYLFLLFLLPLILLWRGRKGQRAALEFPSTRILGQIAALVKSKPGKWSRHLRWLTFLFLILALARPQGGTETTNIEHSGVDIMLAVDLSTSMWAHDFEIQGSYVDRLSVVKAVLKPFIENRPQDRIGLIVFAGDPYLTSPLTLNHSWIKKRIDEIQIGMINDGTAIGTSIASAVKRLKDIEAESKIIILLTDGSNNTGQIAPLQAAEVAAALDIKIYTVGIGKEGLVNSPVLNRDGTLRLGRDGKPYFRRMESDIDLATLEDIATTTEAAFYHATNFNELKEIYNEIDQLEKTEATLNIKVSYQEYFWIPLLVAIAFFFLELILNHTLLKRLP